jgi:hypothetical protein
MQTEIILKRFHIYENPKNNMCLNKAYGDVHNPMFHAVIVHEQHTIS